MMGRFAGLFKSAERKTSLRGRLSPLGAVEPTPEADAVAENGRRAMRVLLEMLEGKRIADREAARRIMLSQSTPADQELFGERMLDVVERGMAHE